MVRMQFTTKIAWNLRNDKMMLKFPRVKILTRELNFIPSYLIFMYYFVGIYTLSQKKPQILSNAH